MTIRSIEKILLCLMTGLTGYLVGFAKPVRKEAKPKVFFILLALILFLGLLTIPLDLGDIKAAYRMAQQVRP